LHTVADLKAGKLKGLTHLKISENLTEFPTEILQLTDTLEVLDLNDNKLSQLPTDFSCLKKLKILFMSDNTFEHIPSVLSECPALTMIGIKSNQIKTVAENSLPVNTRWLILTGNHITKLPDSMGQLTKLEKLALAGNQLTELPSSMENCRALALARLSANKLTALPDFLLQLPKLAWIAFAGNPFNQTFNLESDLPVVSFDDLEYHEVLGQGASGVISRATWLNAQHELNNSDQSVAVKVYKGAVTSDGYANDELGACVSAGSHPNLVEVIAKVEKNTQLGLVMALIEPEFSNLGEPPTLQSCTRDHFKDDYTLTVTAVFNIVKSISSVMQHLLEKGISHGDLYAHNILVANQTSDTKTLFTDFGAASNYASLPKTQASDLQSVEIRAFGCLVDDLLGCCNEQNNNKINEQTGLFERLESLKNNCLQANGSLRPTFKQINAELGSIVS
jgi:hypothetical protein